MKFYTYGKRENTIIVMLPGSFCPASAMDYIYDELKSEYYIIAAEYNGHFPNSNFTSRKGEAAEIAEYLAEQSITSVGMILGHSMGCEIGIELMKQLAEKNIKTEKAFFDGAPCIKLSKACKAFMHFKFKTLINLTRTKTADDIINRKFIKKFAHGDAESLRPMIEAIIAAAPFITSESIKNEVECCYTFDFPHFHADTEKNMYFFYGREEKAFKTCFVHVKKSVPQCKF